MPDVHPPQAVRRSPLEGCALPDLAQVKAVALPFAARWILRGGADAAAEAGAAFGAAPPSQPLRAIREGSRAALWMGPDEWLLIAEDAQPDVGEALEVALAGVAHGLVDVSDRQCAIDVSGPGAARLLSAGVPLDLDLSAFPKGMVTRTVLMKAEIVLWRVDAERFRVEIARSFAPYVAAVLMDCARDQELC
jgi:sarcosine oxidase, subunit gamma